MKINPYYINKDLRKKGWKCDDTGVYIPYESQDGSMYLKISKKEKFFRYETFKKGNTNPNASHSIMRSTNMENDIKYDNGERVNLSPYGTPNFLKEKILINFLGTLGFRKVMGIKGTELFIKKLLNDIKDSGCLEILTDQYYYNKEFENFKKLEEKIKNLFFSRKDIEKARRMLADWLKTKYDIILRKNTHDIYILDEDNNCYTQITKDDLIIKISKDLKPQLINNKDLETALTHISDRLDPQHNIVKFANCVYDMKKLEIIDTEEPIFTLIESKYKYNPDAKSTILKEFLNSSLKKSTKKETDDTVLGIKQVVGYLFTSGNISTLLFLITGVSGGGKSVFSNILEEIFGKDKVADLKLQEIQKDTHATSSLINKHLNIIQDSDDSTISNNSLIKQMTGNDSLQVNPKYKDPFVIPKEEVPKTIVVCNNIPYFRRLETALLERFLIIEFNEKFRGTDKENPNLLAEILSNPEEIEWFIYESIQAYKNMIESGEKFILKKDIETTKKIIEKHQNPLSYLLTQVIDDYNPSAKNADNLVYTNDLNSIICLLAKENGVDLELNRNGKVPPRKLINTIRTEFDLFDFNYMTSTKDGSRYYPGLITNNGYWIKLNEIDSERIPAEIAVELFKEEENRGMNTSNT